MLSHVGTIFKNLEYKLVLCNDLKYFLEFSCNIGYLDTTGVDMISLNSKRLIETFGVVMRPNKSVGKLRKSMKLFTYNYPLFAGLRETKD